MTQKKCDKLSIWWCSLFVIVLLVVRNLSCFNVNKFYTKTTLSAICHRYFYIPETVQNCIGLTCAVFRRASKVTPTAVATDDRSTTDLSVQQRTCPLVARHRRIIYCIFIVTTGTDRFRWYCPGSNHGARSMLDDAWQYVTWAYYRSMI